MPYISKYSLNAPQHSSPPGRKEIFKIKADFCLEKIKSEKSTSDSYPHTVWYYSPLMHYPHRKEPIKFILSAGF